MARKDPEVAKLEAEQKKVELTSLMLIIKERVDRVPKSVVDGSQNLAIRYKDAARKGMLVLNSKRPSLKTARECVSDLLQFN
jgi:hypothetical protein